jgi:hypothetical protein
MGHVSSSTGDTSHKYAKQRTVPRYTFVATADMKEACGDACLSGQISEISRKGCYVDTVNTLPKETLINMRISQGQSTFASRGKIIYVQERSGMGVGFIDPAPEQLELLDGWLLELSAKR